MPYEMNWYIEGRIVFARLFGTITTPDTLDMGKSLATLLDAYPGECIHIIVDTCQVERLQLTLFEVATPGFHGQTTENGWTIIVGSPNNAMRQVLKLLVARFSKLFKSPIRAEANLDAAVAFLMEMDHSLERYLSKTA